MKPTLELGNLNGPEGNSFVILGRAQKVARDNKMDWEPIRNEAQSGDYDHLLDTLAEYFDLEYIRWP